jgi:hypothetical protein
MPVQSQLTTKGSEHSNCHIIHQQQRGTNNKRRKRTRHALTTARHQQQQKGREHVMHQKLSESDEECKQHIVFDFTFCALITAAQRRTRSWPNKTPLQRKNNKLLFTYSTRKNRGSNEEETGTE